MVAVLEIRLGVLWTQRRMCQDGNHFPLTNGMIMKISDLGNVSFNQEKKKKKKAIRNPKENKK